LKPKFQKNKKKAPQASADPDEDDHELDALMIQEASQKEQGKVDTDDQTRESEEEKTKAEQQKYWFDQQKEKEKRTKEEYYRKQQSQKTPEEEAALQEQERIWDAEVAAREEANNRWLHPENKDDVKVEEKNEPVLLEEPQSSPSMDSFLDAFDGSDAHPVPLPPKKEEKKVEPKVEEKKDETKVEEKIEEPKVQKKPTVPAPLPKPLIKRDVIKPSTPTLQAPILWAQKKDQIFLSIPLQDLALCEIKVEETLLSFTGVANGSNYQAHLEFYGLIDKDKSKYLIRPRSADFVLFRKESGSYWPHLLKQKGKFNWIKADWDKWVDEDVDDEGGFDMGGMGNFDFGSGNTGGSSQFEDSDEEEIPDLAKTESKKNRRNKE